jgi:hypothetical protein
VLLNLGAAQVSFAWVCDGSRLLDGLGDGVADAQIQRARALVELQGPVACHGITSKNHWVIGSFGHSEVAIACSCAPRALRSSRLAARQAWSASAKNFCSAAVMAGE